MNNPYKLSNDYRLLKRLLDEGYEIVCFFDKDICKARILEGRYYFSVRGICYNDFNEGCMPNLFYNLMEKDKVTFILPTNPI